MSRLPEELLGAKVNLGHSAVTIEDPLLRITGTDPELQLEATREQAQLRISGVGVITAERGAHVCIDPASPEAEVELGDWLVSTIVALLLAQQGRFALHSSVVAVRGTAVALAGHRGAGKSTTALMLAQRGHELIADDVAPLRLNRRAIVTPYGRPIHVVPEAAEAIGLDLSKAMSFPDDPKLELPPPPSRESRLDTIVVLRPQLGEEQLTVCLQSGAAAAATVAENVYRSEILASIYAREIFEWAAMVAGQATVFVLRRPQGEWTLDPVCSTIEVLAERHRARTVSA